MRIIQTDKPLKPRDEHDFYPTPLPFAIAGINLLPVHFSPQNILDPGAGSGVWGQAAKCIYRDALVTGIELRAVNRHPAYNFWYTGDFRLLATDEPCFDLVVGNPPYKYSEVFIRSSLAMLNDDGYLVFLMPLQFLAGQARGKGLWRQYPPEKVSVCSKRPSWTGDGKTDASEYAFYVWRKGWRGSPTIEWSL